METVKIQGEPFPIKFGMSAIKEVIKLTGGKSLKDLSGIDDMAVGKIPAFILAGLKCGASIEQVDPPTTEQIEAELETNFLLYMEVMEIFASDITPQNEVDAKSGN